MSDAIQNNPVSDTPDCFKQKSDWGVRFVAYLSLIFLTLAFAPNYRWKSDAERHPFGADFLQEWVGAKMLLSGNADQLYDLDAFRRWQHDPAVVGFRWDSENYYPAVYPPMHYALFTPFAVIPYRWAATLWVLLLWASVFGCAHTLVQICRHELNQHATLDPERADWLRYLWLAIVLFPSVHIAILFGQKSILWLWIVCAVCRLLQQQRSGLAGALFGLLSLKPTLFFLLPLLMLRHGRVHFVLGAGVMVLGIWGLSFAALPQSMWSGYFATLQNASSYGSHAGYRIDWSCNLLAIANTLPPDWVGWGKLALCVPLVMYVLLCVMQPKYMGVRPELFLLGFAGTLLLSPHAYHYDLCVLLLPILWMAAQQPKHAIVYYALLAFAVSISTHAYQILGVPAIALLLLGMTAELRLRGILDRSQVLGGIFEKSSARLETAPR